MKGKLTATELRVSAGCGNVPGREDSEAKSVFGRAGGVFPRKPHGRRTGASCSSEQAASDSP